MERPLALGAALAGADDTSTRALRATGRSAGLAFQLRDDLHGAFGDPGQTGKPSGDDIREGKLTSLIAIARTRAWPKTIQHPWPSWPGVSAHPA